MELAITLFPDAELVLLFALEVVALAAAAEPVAANY
jgi:hypothetical protein